MKKSRLNAAIHAIQSGDKANRQNLRKYRLTRYNLTNGEILDENRTWSN
jgi:hypothetical protein